MKRHKKRVAAPRRRFDLHDDWADEPLEDDLEDRWSTDLLERALHRSRLRERDLKKGLLESRYSRMSQLEEEEFYDLD